MTNTMFMKNKYEQFYFRLINSRKIKPHSKTVFTERHHIIPRCMGGSNDNSNIVRLTPREHFIAHCLLVKFVDAQYRYKMLEAVAAFRMCRELTREDMINNSRRIELIRKANAEASKNRNMGNEYWMNRRQETQEDRERKRETATGRRFINNGSICVFIKAEECQKFIDNGWSFGKLKNGEPDPFKEINKTLSRTQTAHCIDCKKKISLKHLLGDDPVHTSRCTAFKDKTYTCQWCCNMDIPHGIYMRSHGDKCSGNPLNGKVIGQCDYCMAYTTTQTNSQHGIYCKSNPLRFEDPTLILFHDFNEHPEKYSGLKKTCEYCNFATAYGYYFKYHGLKCTQNKNRTPEAIQEASEIYKRFKKQTCKFCQKTVSNSVFARCHGDKCPKNPNHNISEAERDKKEQLAAHMRSQLKTCVHCKKTDIVPASYGLYHGDFCKENPNRVYKQCEHCNKASYPSVWNRYHGDNCSSKKVSESINEY